MNGSQKLENLLNLSLEAAPEERGKSYLLNVGVDRETERWELIIRYHGDVEVIRALPDTAVEPLLGGYAIVWTTQEQIPVLAALEGVEYVEKPKQLLYQVENGRAMSCINELQRGPWFIGNGDPEESMEESSVDSSADDGAGRAAGSKASGSSDLYGRGVLIAVLDSGVDYRLPEFRRGDGSSRILYLWDQVEEKEYSAAQLDALLSENRESAVGRVPGIDLSGHGTAVAAIAAGGSSRYRGVAPESELLIVKLGTAGPRSFPRTTQLMRGIDRVLRKALVLGRPVAINISMGNNYGSHDGTSLLERFLDTAAGFSPNVIVVGSGNEGAGAGHVRGRLSQPVPGEDAFEQVELSVGVYEASLSVQLWKSYVDVFDVELISPGGETTGVLGKRRGAERYRLGETQVLVYFGEPKPYSSSQEILMELLPRDKYLDSGIWTVRLTPKKIVDGWYDLWLPGASVLNRGTQFLRQSPEVTLTIPSTAAGVITVGAYDARRLTYADFSGRGYLRNLNLVKPELAAPGVNIRVPGPGGGFPVVTGTSFAAPFVTGAAALLMEWGMIRGNDPYLYGEKVKAYLMRGAKPLGTNVTLGRLPVDYPNARVGYGALCVKDSIPREDADAG